MPAYKAAMDLPSRPADGESPGGQAHPIDLGSYAGDLGGQRYKIQVLGVGGQWGDLKGRFDDEPYQVEVFRTKVEAQAEVDSIIEETDAGAGEYRVVGIDSPEGMDFYG